MDELSLVAEREENPSPAGILAATVTTALATCVLFFAPTVFAQPANHRMPLCRLTRLASNPPRVIAKPASASRMAGAGR